MIKTRGILKYGPGITAKILLDRTIQDYYLSLLPKSKDVQPQKYQTHVTVVRLNKELPTKMEFWEKHANEIVEIKYIPIVYFDETYYFLKAFSDRIGDIREELELPRFRVGFDCYHITLGNTKQ